jgi:hypothetical protein
MGECATPIVLIFVTFLLAPSAKHGFSLRSKPAARASSPERSISYAHNLLRLPPGARIRARSLLFFGMVCFAISAF